MKDDLALGNLTAGVGKNNSWPREAARKDERKQIEDKLHNIIRGKYATRKITGTRRGRIRIRDLVRVTAVLLQLGNGATTSHAIPCSMKMEQSHHITNSKPSIH